MIPRKYSLIMEEYHLGWSNLFLMRYSIRLDS